MAINATNPFIDRRCKASIMNPKRIEEIIRVLRLSIRKNEEELRIMKDLMGKQRRYANTGT